MPGSLQEVAVETEDAREGSISEIILTFKMKKGCYCTSSWLKLQKGKFFQSLHPVDTQPYDLCLPSISVTSLSIFFSLTWELQSEALLASEEICGELQADCVEGAVGIRGQHWATQLSQQDPSILGPIPDPKHIVDLLRVENKEMQTGRDKNKVGRWKSI